MTSIRGLEFGMVLTDPFVMQFLRNKTLVEIADLGAGTNDEIAMAVLGQAVQYLDGKQVIIYLIDRNPSWLSILSQRLPRNLPGIVLVHAELEQVTKKARIIESRGRMHQWNQTSTIQMLVECHRISPASMDLAVFNRDMLGWMQFFTADTDRVLKETQKILKQEGLLILTQPGQKYKHSDVLLEDYGFTFVKRCVIQLETGKRSESTTPTRVFEGPTHKEYIYLIYQNQSL